MSLTNNHDDGFSQLAFLIVDDFEQMRVTFRGILRSLGAENITAANNGEAALRALKLRRFDVVLCDYNLGEGKDGQQVLEEARELSLLRHTDIFIMVSGEALIPRVMAVIEQRPDGYLIKPLVPEMLLQRVKETRLRKQRLLPVEEAYIAKEYERAITECDRLVTTDRLLYGEVTRIKVDILIAMGRLEEASQVLNNILNQRSIAWARFDLAKVRFHQGRYREAADGFSELIEENRLYVEAYDWLARALERLEQSERVVGVLREAVAISPKSVRRQKALGLAARKSGDKELAAQAFRAAVREGRYSAFGGAEEHIALARLLFDEKKTQKALQVLIDATKSFNDEPGKAMEVLAMMARCQIMLDQKGVAGESVERALALFQRFPDTAKPETIIDLARLCFELGLMKQGKGLMEFVIRNFFDNNAMLARVHDVYVELSLEQEGAEIIAVIKEKMKRLNNDAVALFNEGKLEEAVGLMTQAAEGMPHNLTVNINAARGLIGFMSRRGASDGMLFHARQYIEQVRQLSPNGSEHEELLRQYERLISY